jgi:hypothetical protein
MPKHLQQQLFQFKTKTSFEKYDFLVLSKQIKFGIQAVIESCTDILTTSYWLHVELAKNI